jgi:hypothetical protein
VNEPTWDVPQELPLTGCAVIAIVIAVVAGLRAWRSGHDVIEAVVGTLYVSFVGVIAVVAAALLIG